MADDPRELRIGPPGGGRRLFGWLAFLALVVVVGGAFVALLGMFTRAWDVAILTGTALLGMMLLLGWLAERGAKDDQNAMR